MEARPDGVGAQHVAERGRSADAGPGRVEDEGDGAGDGPEGLSREALRGGIGGRGKVFGQQAALVLIEDGSGRRGRGILAPRTHRARAGHMRGHVVHRTRRVRAFAGGLHMVAATRRGARGDMIRDDEDDASREDFHQRVG